MASHVNDEDNRSPIQMKKNIAWLELHFKPTLSFHIGRYWFGFMPQWGKHEEYAIKKVDLLNFEQAIDEGNWLPGRYETESGCAYAILRYLESLND